MKKQGMGGSAFLWEWGGWVCHPPLSAGKPSISRRGVGVAVPAACVPA